MMNEVLVDLSSGTVDRQISSILMRIGITPNRLGFHYLKDLVKLRIANPYGKLTKDLYPIVGKNYDKAPNSVEHCVRTVIAMAFNKGTLSNINEIMGLRVCGKDYCLTNSELIALIAEKICEAEVIEWSKQYKDEK